VFEGRESIESSLEGASDHGCQDGRAWQFRQRSRSGDRPRKEGLFVDVQIQELSHPRTYAPTLPHSTSPFHGQPSFMISYSRDLTSIVCLLGIADQTQRKLHSQQHTPPCLSFRLTACWCSRKIQVRLKNARTHKAKNQPPRCFR
jgi:hypothetical protein